MERIKTSRAAREVDLREQLEDQRRMAEEVVPPFSCPPASVPTAPGGRTEHSMHVFGSWAREGGGATPDLWDLVMKFY